jgi:hypothetical protein
MRWAALAAAVVLALSLSLVILRQGGQTPMPDAAGEAIQAKIDPALSEFLAAEATYEEAAALLMEIVDSRRDELSPETVAVLDENLKIINGAIDEVRRALAADPADASSGHALTALHQQRMQILWRVARLSS